MCAVNFAAKMFQDEWRTGFDPIADWVGQEDDIVANGGDGRQYPFVQTCTFKGKQILCYCCCSESGSINGKLLTDILHYLDSLNLFDQSVGLNPFLLLDGHGSHFKLKFLEYIDSCET
jgi:hypothetical protein